MTPRDPIDVLAESAERFRKERDAAWDAGAVLRWRVRDLEAEVASLKEERAALRDAVMALQADLREARAALEATP